MEWLIHNWFWVLLGFILAGFSFAVTRHAETQRYRIRLIISLLILEAWFCLATKATSPVELLALGILGVGLMRVCMPALSHIVAQKMADKATDAMFGEHEPAPPSLEHKAVRKLRKERRYEDAVKHLEAVLLGTPDDFESRILLARIYAEDLRDLAAAEREMNTILKSKTISPSVQAMARQRLEIWQETYRSVGLLPEKQPDASPARSASLHSQNATVQVEAARFASLPEDTPVITHQTIEDLCQSGKYGSAIAMIDQIVTEKPDDFKGLAIKARICVQFLRQPPLADKALRQLLAASDFDSEQAAAVDQLAEAFTKTKEDGVKAGRLWRKILEMPSVPLEQKVVVQARLKKWTDGLAV